MIEAADCGGRITSKRGKDKTVARYFLMSQNYRPKDVMRIVRAHWTTLRAKLKRAGWNDAFLFDLLGHMR